MCDTCHAELARLSALPACPHCGRTLPSPAIHENRCARCRPEHFWNLAAIIRLAPYEPVIRTPILHLKYAGHDRNADFLATLLADALRPHDWPPTLAALVPIPMHRLRRLQRPCDHSLALARALAKRLNLKVCRALKRTKQSPSQTHFQTRHQRFQNVKNCFAATSAADALRGRTVCLVDNLIVSGATICEAAKTLHRIGVRRIYAAVLARPPAPGDPPANLPPSP